jgi:tripartite-type tricarboxylate transporter receptor subunit TctC
MPKRRTDRSSVLGVNQATGSAVAAVLALLVLALLAFVPAASAQDLRDKTIRIVVPFPPGGSADTLARLVSQQITQTTGQKFVVENRPGAGTVIATDSVARSAPDGATVLIMSNSFVINGIVRATLPYDPLTSFEPVCFLVDSPQVLVVNAAAPHRSLKDLVDAAKAKPGELSYAAVGPATTQHIAGEMFKQAAGINLTYVPYAGGAPAVNALLGGHVATVLANYNEVSEQLSAGKLRPLAVASRERIKPLPEVPTFIEQGYQDFETSAFFGVVAPARTPKEAIGQLAFMLQTAIKAPEVVPKLVAQGFHVVGTCGEDFRTHIRRQHEKYTRAIREGNIKAE